MNSSVQGLIASIQKCSVHDGPGIRTTVFVKGCNLRCAWCHNPETLSFEPEVLFYPDRCIGCGRCDEGCFSGAKVVCGERKTAAEVRDIVLQDLPYYGSEGGLTVSGGEPTCQPEFTEALLTLCGEAGIHTAMETNLLADWTLLSRLIARCRLVMADYKLFDSDRHREFTGAGNEALPGNLRRLSESGVSFLIRTPVIRGLNDGDDVPRIAEFLGKLPGLVAYELLPYHPLGLSKGVRQKQTRFEAPSREELEALALRAARCCPEVRIAGKRVSVAS